MAKERTRDQVKVLIELSSTIEEAKEVVNQELRKDATVKEKIAFLKGMYECDVIDAKEDDSDELIYDLMLNAIIIAKYES